ncbi:unnamed protein product [Amoebophrya sp. A25]|nr:unnamed protein product [Amoebophrya sp. A25]|eukprot:GSA25T00017117001.1
MPPRSKSINNGRPGPNSRGNSGAKSRADGSGENSRRSSGERNNGGRSFPNSRGNSASTSAGSLEMEAGKIEAGPGSASNKETTGSGAWTPSTSASSRSPSRSSSISSLEHGSSLGPKAEWDQMLQLDGAEQEGASCPAPNRYSLPSLKNWKKPGFPTSSLSARFMVFSSDSGSAGTDSGRCQLKILHNIMSSDKTCFESGVAPWEGGRDTLLGRAAYDAGRAAYDASTGKEFATFFTFILNKQLYPMIEEQEAKNNDEELGDSLSSPGATSLVLGTQTLKTIISPLKTIILDFLHARWRLSPQIQLLDNNNSPSGGRLNAGFANMQEGTSSFFACAFLDAMTKEAKQEKKLGTAKCTSGEIKIVAHEKGRWQSFLTEIVEPAYTELQKVVTLSCVDMVRTALLRNGVARAIADENKLSVVQYAATVGGIIYPNLNDPILEGLCRSSSPAEFSAEFGKFRDAVLLQQPQRAPLDWWTSILHLARGGKGDQSARDTACRQLEKFVPQKNGHAILSEAELERIGLVTTGSGAGSDDLSPLSKQLDRIGRELSSTYDQKEDRCILRLGNNIFSSTSLAVPSSDTDTSWRGVRDKFLGSAAFHAPGSLEDVRPIYNDQEGRLLFQDITSMTLDSLFALAEVMVDAKQPAVSQVSDTLKIVVVVFLQNYWKLIPGLQIFGGGQRAMRANSANARPQTVRTTDTGAVGGSLVAKLQKSVFACAYLEAMLDRSSDEAALLSSCRGAGTRVQNEDSKWSTFLKAKVIPGYTALGKRVYTACTDSVWKHLDRKSKVLELAAETDEDQVTQWSEKLCQATSAKEFFHALQNIPAFQKTSTPEPLQKASTPEQRTNHDVMNNAEQDPLLHPFTSGVTKCLAPEDNSSVSGEIAQSLANWVKGGQETLQSIFEGTDYNKKAAVCIFNMLFSSEPLFDEVIGKDGRTKVVSSRERITMLLRTATDAPRLTKQINSAAQKILEYSFVHASDDEQNKILRAGSLIKQLEQLWSKISGDLSRWGLLPSSSGSIVSSMRKNSRAPAVQAAHWELCQDFFKDVLKVWRVAKWQRRKGSTTHIIMMSPHGEKPQPALVTNDRLWRFPLLNEFAQKREDVIQRRLYYETSDGHQHAIQVIKPTSVASAPRDEVHVARGIIGMCRHSMGLLESHPLSDTAFERQNLGRKHLTSICAGLLERAQGICNAKIGPPPERDMKPPTSSSFFEESSSTRNVTLSVFLEDGELLDTQWISNGENDVLGEADTQAIGNEGKADDGKDISRDHVRKDISHEEDAVAEGVDYNINMLAGEWYTSYAAGPTEMIGDLIATYGDDPAGAVWKNITEHPTAFVVSLVLVQLLMMLLHRLRGGRGAPPVAHQGKPVEMKEMKLRFAKQNQSSTADDASSSEEEEQVLLK